MRLLLVPTLACLAVATATAACSTLKDDEPRPDAGIEAGALDAGDAGDTRDAPWVTVADAANEAGPVAAPKTCATCSTGTAGNGDTGLCEPCTPLASDATEFYVDASSNSVTGSAACPVKTITRALDLASTSTSTGMKTIHLSAGVYDAALGEVFPLRVPGAVSVVGAGAAKSFIRGIAPWQEDEAIILATVVAGSSNKATTIAGVSLRPGVYAGTVAAGTEHVGVFCERGDTTVRGAQIGPGYVEGVKVDNNTATESGTITVTSSAFDGADSPLSWASGVFAAGHGCGSVWGRVELRTQALRPIKVTVGDDAAGGGNVFSHFGRPSYEVWVTGCVSTVTVTGNTFRDGMIGALIEVGDVDGAPRANVSFSKNVFDGVGEGISFQASKATVTLTDNTFRAISAAPGATAPGVAVDVMRGDRPGMLALPSVLRARGNHFVGNDVGVKISGALDSTSTIDLAGNNEFRCNSAPASGGFTGADVWITSANSGGGSIALGGNLWDRATPTVTTAASFADGTDIALAATPAPVVATAPSQASSLACPAAHAP